MAISANDVARLREETGAGMMAAKKALEEAGGDLDAAKELLRKQGALKAAKRAANATAEGLVYSYIHSTGKIGVMVELQCETDFVARNEMFKELAHQLAMHIAAADPEYLDSASVPSDVRARMQKEFEEEAASGGKPAQVVAKIVEGKIEKWESERVLLKQVFVMDEEKTIALVLSDAVATLGENIRLTRFARFQISGGMSACEASRS